MAVAMKKREQIAEIADTVRAVQLTTFPAWNDLDVLSNHTRIDGIGVDPEGITVRGSQFSGLAAVYVVLEYDQGPDQFTTSEAFRGKFTGHIEAGKPVIEDFTVDTSPFFADAEE